MSLFLLFWVLFPWFVFSWRIAARICCLSFIFPHINQIKNIFWAQIKSEILFDSFYEILTTLFSFPFFCYLCIKPFLDLLPVCWEIIFHVRISKNRKLGENILDFFSTSLLSLFTYLCLQFTLLISLVYQAWVTKMDLSFFDLNSSINWLYNNLVEY